MVWLLPLEFFRMLSSLERLLPAEKESRYEGQRVGRRKSDEEVEGRVIQESFLVICAASAPPLACRNVLVCATACSGQCLGETFARLHRATLGAEGRGANTFSTLYLLCTKFLKLLISTKPPTCIVCEILLRYHRKSRCLFHLKYFCFLTLSIRWNFSFD